MAVLVTTWEYGTLLKVPRHVQAPAQPYEVQWLSNTDTIKVEHTVDVSFKIDTYKDSVECGVVPMTVYHLVLGHPWQFDCGVIPMVAPISIASSGRKGIYVCRPMSPNQGIADKSSANKTFE